jgi:hypothetical protein
MMTLSREAGSRLDQYLNEMRASLVGSTEVDVVEVEQDIRDHVEADLGENSAPVSVETLNRVLERLGSPHQWAHRETSTRTPERAPSGLDDRLVYASAGGMVVFLVFPPLLVLSWLLARWTLARIEDSGQPVGPRQWLLYPPLLVVDAPLGVLALFWPLAPAAEFAGRLFNQPTPFTSPPGDVVGAIAMMLACLGVYWILLGAALAVGHRLVRLLFYPFADGFRGRHGWWLTGIGTALSASTVSVLLFLRG